MKNLLLAILFIIGIQTFMQAQQIDYGVQAGVVLSKIKGPSIRNFNGEPLEILPQFGFSLNAYIGLYTDKKVFVSLEPGYIRKGAFYEKSPDFSMTDYHLYLHYLQLPALVNFRVHEKITLSVGPEIAYVLGVGSDQDFPVLEDIYGDRLEVSAMAGAGFLINENWSVGARYNMGISPISNIMYTDIVGRVDTSKKERNCYGVLFLRYTI